MARIIMRITAPAIAVMLLFSGLALAQRDHDDDDGGYYRGGVSQARRYGYQSGYSDGIRKGREEGREHDPFDYRTPDWRQATRGYQSWMGPANWFRQGYQEGYRSGFESGYQSMNRRGDGDGDRDDGYGRGNYGWHGGGYGYGNPAYNIGYQDGSTVARQDLERGKKFNPKPRGPYDDKDHGYRQEYGDKNAYRTQYTNGYRAGYEANYHRGYSGY
jgi:hypothetical protein